MRTTCKFRGFKSTECIRTYSKVLFFAQKMIIIAESAKACDSRCFDENHRAVAMLSPMRDEKRKARTEGEKRRYL